MSKSCLSHWIRAVNQLLKKGFVCQSSLHWMLSLKNRFILSGCHWHTLTLNGFPCVSSIPSLILMNPFMYAILLIYHSDNNSDIFLFTTLTQALTGKKKKTPQTLQTRWEKAVFRVREGNMFTKVHPDSLWQGTEEKVTACAAASFKRLKKVLL